MTATALLLLASLSAPPAEPPAADPRIAAWVADLSDADFAKRRAAYEALCAAGPKAKAAVPALIELLNPENGDRFWAAGTLGAIGPDAKEAVPALLALLPKKQTFDFGVESVAYAVARIDGPKPEATRALLLTDGKCRTNTLVGSRTLNEYPAQVIPHVVALCDDPDATVRGRAVATLGTLKLPVAAGTKSLLDLAGDGAKGVVPALEKRLGDAEISIRLGAAEALVAVAPESGEKVVAAVVAIAVDDKAGADLDVSVPAHIFSAVPAPAANALVPLLDHPSARVRAWAVGTLGATLPVVEPILAALKDGRTARTREGAALALGERNGTAPTAPLKAALADPEFAVRFAAARSIVRGGRAADTGGVATPVLVAGLGDATETVRVEATRSLLTAGPAATAAVPALTTALADATADVRLGAAQALVAIDPKAAAPALKKLLDDPNREVRLETALALVAIDPKDAAGTVPALAEGLRAAPDEKAVRTARALAELGPVATDAVPDLVKHFGAENIRLRLAAVEAAARIDPAQGPKAAEALIGVIQNKDYQYQIHIIRRDALVALRHIGPAAKSAAPALADQLKIDGPFPAEVALALIAVDPTAAEPAREWVRKEIAAPASHYRFALFAGLPELGRAAAPLVPELRALLAAVPPAARKCAIRTLAAIGPDARAALPELKALAENEPVPELKALAADAVQKIEAK